LLEAENCAKADILDKLRAEHDTEKKKLVNAMKDELDSM
jgi:hypothetical protein